MSRLAELIEQLCPDGVEYKPIGSFAQCVAGATPNSKDPSLWDGNIPWMSSGEVNKRIIRSTDRCITQRGFDSCSTKMIPAGAVVVALAGQGKTRGTVARTRIELCTNQSLCAIISDANVDSNFLFHYLVSQYNNLRAVSSGDGTRGGLNLKMIREYRVPFPPLEVQREIARILDQFTTLEAELEAELEARRAQYEHYRNHLLSYESLAARGPVSWIPLREFGVWSGGGTPSKSRADYWDEGNIPWITPKDMRSSKIQNSMMNVTDRAVRESNVKLIEAPSIALVVRSSILQHTFPVAQIDVDATFNQDMKVLVVDPDRFERRYIYYALSANGQEILRQTSKQGGSVNSLVVPQLMDFEIPVPEIDEQRRIADLLDRFDALVNDISSGLPAEIAARRAQYEHYRDRLLSFPEKCVSDRGAS